MAVALTSFVDERTARSTWFAPRASYREVVGLLAGQADGTFVITASQLSEALSLSYRLATR